MLGTYCLLWVWQNALQENTGSVRRGLLTSNAVPGDAEPVSWSQILRNKEPRLYSNSTAKYYRQFTHTQLRWNNFTKLNKELLKGKKKNAQRRNEELEHSLLQTDHVTERLNTVLPSHSCRGRTLFLPCLKRGRFAAVGMESEHRLEKSVKMGTSWNRHEHAGEKDTGTSSLAFHSAWTRDLFFFFFYTWLKKTRFFVYQWYLYTLWALY